MLSGEPLFRRRQLTLANLDRINPDPNYYRRRIIRELAFPVLFGGTGALFGGGISAALGQGMVNGNILGGSTGVAMSSAGRLACHIRKKCKECDDARDREEGRLPQRNPIRQAASGASKD